MGNDPEIAAMAAICAILRDLSDNERLRVMRWAFGRFSDEFKRPLPESAATPEPPQVAELASAPATAASALPDFERQISELHDLFPSRVAPQGRACPDDPRKILEFVLAQFVCPRLIPGQRTHCARSAQRP